MRALPISFAVLLVLSTALAAPAAARTFGELTLSAGGFDVVDRDDEAVEVGVELGLAPVAVGFAGRSLELVPVVGAMATGDSGLYGYGGLRLDLPLGRRFVLAPQLGAGLYEPGDGKDLGGAVHFRSGLELAWLATPRHRLGVALYHLSNAGLENSNPGSESVILTWRTRW